MTTNLINKNDGKTYKIYDIVYDKTGYPHFLIYKDSEWVRMSAKHFRPYTIEDSMGAFREFVNSGTLTVQND